MKKCFHPALTLGVLFLTLLLHTMPVQAFQSSAAGIAPVLSEVQKERDHILSLLTLAFVHNDWQQEQSTVPRGHNIGSVLADEHGMPVFWTRNSVKNLHNSNQHGEVRLATRYLSNIPSNKYMPKGYVLYTSLEPCAMCTGMLSMVQTERVVYVQKDPEYGNVAEALKSINYPRVYDVLTPADMPQKKALDEGWIQFKEKGNKSITDYLLTDDAERIYQSAKTDLAQYTPKHKENTHMLEAAKMLAHSTLPELSSASASAQKIWQTARLDNSANGSSNFMPSLFITYQDWSKQKRIAQVAGDALYLCTAQHCEEAKSIQYMNAGKPWSATVANGIFTHKDSKGASHQDGTIIYEDWNGTMQKGVIRDIQLPD